MLVAFEYRYRDAGNFKAYGCIVLDRAISPSEEGLVRRRLENGELFIAEQVGIPPLYEQLYQWSNGPTQSDHCWHEFVAFRAFSGPPTHVTAEIATRDLVASFEAVQRWEETRSPHFSET